MLDEIGDLPLEQQIKLLRVIELKQYTPVGDTTAKSCDARIISATNRDLFSAIEAGRFREDLYFRLAGMHIHLPPLRERLEDIELLTLHFLKRLGASEPEARLTPELVAELKSRPWRGNVRELRNAIEHAYLMSRGRPLRPEHLPQTASYQPVPTARPESTPVTLGAVVDQPKLEAKLAELVHQWLSAAATDPDSAINLHEKLLAIIEPPVLRYLLEKHHGNKSALAQQLGWHRATVRRRLQQYGID